LFLIIELSMVFPDLSLQALADLVQRRHGFGRLARLLPRGRKTRVELRQLAPQRLVVRLRAGQLLDDVAGLFVAAKRHVGVGKVGAVIGDVRLQRAHLLQEGDGLRGEELPASRVSSSISQPAQLYTGGRRLPLEVAYLIAESGRVLVVFQGIAEAPTVF